MMDEANLNDIPFDASYIDAIVNYLIPINILHSSLLNIPSSYKKSFKSKNFFIVSNIILVIVKLFIFSFTIDIFYIIPYLVLNIIYYNKRKEKPCLTS